VKVHEIAHNLKNFLFSRANREFLIFLFFLVLSGIFWLLMTLNETYEQEVKIPVRIVNVPKNVVLTSNETDTIRATIRDKGIVLISYLYGDGVDDISVSFKNYSNGSNMGSIPSQELQKLLYGKLSASSKVTAIKPEQLEFTYNYGEKKRVPIKWSGRVIPEELYFIANVEYSPDSVTIYATPEKLDSINLIYTEPLNYVGFRDTLQVNCQLANIRGVKMIPEHVTARFMTDVLTEESIDGILVKGINMPVGKVLRTFPGKVRVHFVTGVNTFRNLSSSDFEVVADYNDIINNPSPKCSISLRRVPYGISKVRLELEEVDYLIETIN